MENFDVIILAESDEARSRGGSFPTVFLGAKSNDGLAEKLAVLSLSNNQLAEVLTLANEKINDADWRAAHVVETF